ncbi:hypothetical protein BaRGS_00002277, partial [Batillaria attramentaria]
VSASQSMSAKLASRLAMHAGSCTVWSMASSLTVRCPRIKPSEGEMTLSTPSSARPEAASTCHVPFSLTSSLLLS